MNPLLVPYACPAPSPTSLVYYLKLELPFYVRKEWFEKIIMIPAGKLVFMMTVIQIVVYVT